MVIFAFVSPDGFLFLFLFSRNPYRLFFCLFSRNPFSIGYPLRVLWLKPLLHSLLSFCTAGSSKKKLVGTACFQRWMDPSNDVILCFSLSLSLSIKTKWLKDVEQSSTSLVKQKKENKKRSFGAATMLLQYLKLKVFGFWKDWMRRRRMKTVIKYSIIQ